MCVGGGGGGGLRDGVNAFNTSTHIICNLDPLFDCDKYIVMAFRARSH